MGAGLDLPGWAALNAPIRDKWPAVKDATIAPVDGVTDPASAHRWTLEHVTYAPEPGDEWQTPLKTVARGQGDCEDFAILERGLLKAAGWGEPIWLVIAHDLIARTDHAFLVTGDAMLDCRAPQVLELKQFADYRPIIAYCDDEAVSFGKRR